MREPARTMAHQQAAGLKGEVVVVVGGYGSDEATLLTGAAQQAQRQQKGESGCGNHDVLLSTSAWRAPSNTTTAPYLAVLPFESGASAPLPLSVRVCLVESSRPRGEVGLVCGSLQRVRCAHSRER